MSDYTSHFAAVLAHLEDELLAIRTGRASPGLVEQVSVDAYGSAMPLVQLASISTPDARTIVVQPWDRNLMKEIEKALQQADLGAAPVNDGAVVRLSIPSPTEERRREYLKLLHAKLEAARVSIRQVREDALRARKDAKQRGTISEDAFFAQQKELQKEVDAFVEKVAERGKRKEQELMTI